MSKFSKFFTGIAEFFQFSVNVFRHFGANLRRPKETIKAVWKIGVSSILIVGLSGLFIGMILGLQFGDSLEDFIVGTSQFVGGIIPVASFRELAPVLTALIVVSRVCSSVTAELGTMKVTEQIDALRTMSVDPMAHLVAPRVLAGMISLPILTSISNFLIVMGGWSMLSGVLNVNTETFWAWARLPLHAGVVWEMTTKAFVIGAAILLISTFEGFMTKGGADGVGKATIRSVERSSFTVIILDYFIGMLFLIF